MSSRRHHARSPAVTPLDDDDLLCEILLRLPPQPSSLPRASLVCKRWRRLVSDPGFFRRFRVRHRHNLPLLGLFNGFSFLPTLEAPNRIPPSRLSLQRNDDYHSSISLGCRHGLFLIFSPKRLQVLVWDPITGDNHQIAVPAAFGTKKTAALLSGAVLRDARHVQHFQVVLAVVERSDEQHIQALACVYSSITGLWGDLVSYQANGSSFPTIVRSHDAVLVGDSLYWLLSRDLLGVLEFDLVKQSLTVIRVPKDICGQGKCFRMMRAEGGGLGFLLVSSLDYTAKLLKMKADCDGVASWGIARSIELDKLLSLKPEEKGPMLILGCAEENNVVFLWTVIGLFMINLDSLKFKNIFETRIFSHCHPFESVYPAEICASGGHDGAEILLNT